MPLDVQFRVFLLLMLTGMAVGVLYDVTRSVRWAFRARGAWVHLGDMAFWLAATAVLLAGTLQGNWMDLRFYVLLAVATGFVLYLALASPVVLPLLVRLIRLVRRLVRALLHGVIGLILPAVRGGRLAVAPLIFAGLVAANGFRRLAAALRRHRQEPHGAAAGDEPGWGTRGRRWWRRLGVAWRRFGGPRRPRRRGPWRRR